MQANPYTRFLWIFILQLIAFQSLSLTLPADSLRKNKHKTDSSQVSYFTNELEKFGSLKLVPSDTGINGFQNYDPLFQQSHFYANLGNIGSAYRSLSPFPLLHQTGFDYGIHTFDNYLFSNDSIRYYKVIKTFSELKYLQGAKKENLFQVVFSRNLYHSLNMGFNFRVANAPGAYQRQRTNLVNFYLTMQYFSPDKRYGSVANFLINRVRNSENGGIKYDSAFEQNTETNRQIYTVNLNNAVNRVRDIGFYMKHYVDLTSHSLIQKDSTVKTRKRFELGRITYNFEYNRHIQNYIDYNPKSGFYTTIYLDSLKTYDSITITKIVNELTWSNPNFKADRKYRLLQLQFHLRHLYNEVSYQTVKKYFVQFIPVAELSFRPYSSLILNAYGDYVFGDYNQGDLTVKASLTQILGKPEHNIGAISFKVYSCFQQPDYFFDHFFGNNFAWYLSWKKQNVIGAGFSYKVRNVETGVIVSRINNFIYLDTIAQPQQYNNQFGYLYAYMNGKADFWKFNFKTQFAYQTEQGANFLRLPSFLGNLTIVFTQQLFHGAATLQPGFNFFYNTLYYSNAYMPALRSFYLQDSKQTGNYLYMDVFVNVKIQRARIFVMYSHFNASFMGHSYYQVPTYPMQDAAFKFGIDWIFHD
ncbi:MAG: hypothetical protein NTX61_00085 [Bacteroidetes bacterium]|nr:hypothetical protein [Bacteroidota bacterium]